MKTLRKLFYGKSVLISTILTVVITMTIVFLTGISDHRSIQSNALLSLSILSVILILFLFVGLFYGLNVVDDYSHRLQITWGNVVKRLNFKGSDVVPDVELPDFDGDGGIGGILLSILVWIGVTLFLVLILTLLPAILWLSTMIFLLSIYWIVIRALKLVFTKSRQCQGKAMKSVGYALGYGVLYVSWMYGLVWLWMYFD